MHVSKRIGTLVLFGIFSLNSVFAPAQEDESPADHKEFKVTTSISIGLTGPSYSTKFQLVDELGLEFDVMSLVEDPLVTDSVQLTVEQSQQMRDLKRSVTKELQGRLASALATKNGKEEIEARFREVENELRSVMTPDQLILLEYARVQRGVKRFGMPEFLATRAMREEFGLNNADLESLKQTHADAKSNHENRNKLMIEQANLALIAELSAKHQEKLEDLFDDAGMEGFVKSKLFVENKSLRQRKQTFARSLLGQLRIKKVRDALELTDEQNEKIRALNKQVRSMDEDELQNGMNQILSRDQVARLNQHGVITETTRYGTVNELSRGLLGNLLGLTSEESERILETGQQIFAELSEDLKQSKTESVKASIESLSADKQARIIEILGEPSSLKFR